MTLHVMSCKDPTPTKDVETYLAPGSTHSTCSVDSALIWKSTYPFCDCLASASTYVKFGWMSMYELSSREIQREEGSLIKLVEFYHINLHGLLITLGLPPHSW